MGSNNDAWCKYHRVRGHDIDDCIHLKREIKKLIQSGKLRGYTRGRHDENGRGTDEVRNNRRGEENKHTLNTVSGGFAGGGESSASRKNYARQIMLINEGSHVFAEKSSDITFSPKDFEGVVPHDNDPMVITLQILNWNIKRVLIDTDSSADILTFEAFDKMGLTDEQLQPFQGTLSGFTEERVHVRGYITLKTIFGVGKQAKAIKIRYLVVNAPNSYNIVIGCPSFNRLGALLSTKFLVMKYPLDDGGVGKIKGDQKVARECYLASLKLRRKETPRKENKGDSMNMIDLNTWEEYQQERLEPTEDLKEVMIGSQPHQSMKIGTSLAPLEEKDLIQLLRRNLGLFA